MIKSAKKVIKTLDCVFDAGGRLGGDHGCGCASIACLRQCGGKVLPESPLEGDSPWVIQLLV